MWQPVPSSNWSRPSIHKLSRYINFLNIFLKNLFLKSGGNCTNNKFVTCLIYLLAYPYYPVWIIIKIMFLETLNCEFTDRNVALFNTSPTRLLVSNSERTFNMKKVVMSAIRIHLKVF